MFPFRLFSAFSAISVSHPSYSTTSLQDETKVVDLMQDDSLRVTIADALNEQDIVKFTVHTKVCPVVGFYFIYRRTNDNDPVKARKQSRSCFETRGKEGAIMA